MWEIMTAISSVIAAIAIVAIFWQAMMLRKQNRLSAFNSLLETWGSDKERKARRFIFREFKFTGNLDELNEEQGEKVELVLAKCNRISLMAFGELIPEKDVLRLVGRSMIRCWDNCEAFVKARRMQVGESEEGEEWSYMYPFQQFVNKNRTEVGL